MHSGVTCSTSIQVLNDSEIHVPRVSCVVASVVTEKHVDVIRPRSTSLLQHLTLFPTCERGSHYLETVGILGGLRNSIATTIPTIASPAVG